MIQPVLADDAWDAGDMGCGELVFLLFQRMRALGPAGCWNSPPPTSARPTTSRPGAG